MGAQRGGPPRPRNQSCRAPKPTVHVVGGRALVAAIAAGMRAGVAVRLWTRLPFSTEARRSDVLVIEAREEHQHTSEELSRLVGRLPVFAVVDGAAVSSDWLLLMQSGRMRMVRCRGNDEMAFLPIVRALQRQFGHFDARAASAAIAATARLPEELIWVIESVCADPWVVRRPVDLVPPEGRTRDGMRKAVRDAGFARTEHLLTLTRLQLHEHLVRERGYSSRAAWHAAGVIDVSNFRRQLARARRSRGARRVV